jgi:hypothetical protein
MKHIICSIIMVLLAHCALNAQQLSISTGSVIRNANMRWSIAGNSNGTNPNVFSELKWRNVNALGQNLMLDLGLSHRWSFQTNVQIQKTISGKVNDTDYAEDHRQNPVFSASEDASKGQRTNGDLSVGYIIIKRSRLELKLNAGYTLDNQQWFLINKSNNLNSSYSNQWSGWAIGANWNHHLSESWNVGVSFDYLQLNYKASADWNLIDEFMHPVSFTHKAKGYGLHSALKIQYQTVDHLGIFLECSWGMNASGHGIDKVYRSDGQVAYTRLNGVFLSQISIGAGLHWCFTQKAKP